MSKIKTTTSTTRPPDAETGELFFETDTNRLIFWDGSTYHVYNRDSLIQTTGGTEELHYPQGIYADSSATYYISQSPMLHFDTSHMNGVDKTQVYADGVWAQHWYDRTQNNYKYTETTSGFDAVMDLSQSSLMSSGMNTMPCINNNGTYYTPPAEAPTSITGDVTTFFVMQPNSDSNYVTPGPYSDWYNQGANISNPPGTYMHMGDNFANNAGGTPNPAWTNTGETSWVGWRKGVTSASGPGLYIARNSNLGNQVWRPDSRGNHVPMTRGVSNSAPSVATILHTYDMFAWEIMFFDSALTIAEVNKVKSYLQNKYEGLHADFFPTGGTIDLTE
jgi:hypothetical protein